jgi:hypothetical protein
MMARPKIWRNSSSKGSHNRILITEVSPNLGSMNILFFKQVVLVLFGVGMDIKKSDEVCFVKLR